MSYTLGTAAKATGMSRTTILRAIQSRKISAERDVHGNWAIQPAELHRIYPPVNAEQGNGNSISNNTHTHISEDGTGALQVEIALLRERLSTLATEREREREQLTTHIDDLRRRLEAEAEDRRKLTAILTDQRQPQPGFWSRLFKRQ